ncbi:MAG: nucleotidyltransferase domain-containing protein [Lachnospiraceae bacterium]|nr:nucleotidyltransferase domain-containing protein [Lachnospiraceae bacterium]
MIYTCNEIKNTLEPVFRHYGVRYAVLFGSYAKGLQTEKSDIDILVDSGLRGLAFFELLDAVTRVLGKAVDLLDVTQIIPDSLIEKETKETRYLLYGQQG